MKKQFMFLLLLALAITAGAGAVINEKAVTHLNVWDNNTVAYEAEVTDIDSITCVDIFRVWIDNSVKYEKEIAEIYKLDK